jgi:hypothetical protein
MTDTNNEDYDLLSHAFPLAANIMNYAQKEVGNEHGECTPKDTEMIKLALGIGYTTLSKATKNSMYDTIDTVVTIYKHTEVKEDGYE